jgi:predicted metal-binding membrane protein
VGFKNLGSAVLWSSKSPRGRDLEPSGWSTVWTHDFGTGPYPALRTGASHGLYCLGCCWALMSVLFVVGLMNLAWMAAIAVVFLAEKNWRHGAILSKVVGIAVVVLGLVVFANGGVSNSIAA